MISNKKISIISYIILGVFAFFINYWTASRGVFPIDTFLHFDSAVRIIILILIFVFDPLAVLLLIAANISLRQWRDKRNEKKKIEEEETQKNKGKKIGRKKLLTQKLERKTTEISKEFTKIFLVN